MDKDLYKIMEELKCQKSSNKTIDIKYMGSISIQENGKVRTSANH